MLSITLTATGVTALKAIPSSIISEFMTTLTTNSFYLVIVIFAVFGIIWTYLKRKTIKGR